MLRVIFFSSLYFAAATLFCSHGALPATEEPLIPNVDCATALAPDSPRKKIQRIYWTPEMLLEKAKEITSFNSTAAENEKIPWNARAMQKIRSHLPRQNFSGNAFYKAVRNHFGSWNAFLEALGLNAGEVVFHNDWTKERLLEKGLGILRYNAIQTEENQKVPMEKTQITEHPHKLPGLNIKGGAFHVAVLKHYGSWDAFRTALGLAPEQTAPRWTRELLLKKGSELLQYNANLSDNAKKIRLQSIHALRQQNLPQQNFTGHTLYQAIQRHFGTMENFLLELGVKPQPRLKKWPQEKLHEKVLEILRYNAAQSGPLRKVPLEKPEELKKFGMIPEQEFTGSSLHYAVRRYYSSWRDFWIAMGLDPAQLAPQHNKELKEDKP